MDRLPRSASEMGTGVVPTAAEKAAIEEQRRKEAADAAAKSAGGETGADDEEDKDKKGVKTRMAKFRSWMDKFLKEPEE